MRPAIFVAVLVAVACGPSVAAKEAAADGTYAIEQLKCVDKYDTNAEINACRAEVRKRWGITERVTDAGADR